MSADPRLQSDELSMRQPDARPEADELAEDPKDPFVYFFEQLAAEWQPVGFTEWQVILDLTALYSKLREIRPPKVETLQNDPNSAKPNERGTSLIRQSRSA